ncbi:hypothetical protein N9E09_01130 [bacterium]|nr:hypothetical protein [bacterium]
MKLSQLTESFVISNDEFEDYLNRATEQLVSELSSGKNPRDAVHDLALTFADQHNKSYDAYQRMADSLGARMHTLEMNSPTDMMNGPKDDMGMGSVDEPEMMSDPMGNMEMNTPASSEMPSDSDMEDYSAVMGEGRMSDQLIDDAEKMSKKEFEKKHGKEAARDMFDESVNEDSDEEKARQRALAKADEPERGEERKKVSLKKAPWEESVNEKYRQSTQAEIDADEKKDRKSAGKKRPSISPKSIDKNMYNNMKGKLKEGDKEQVKVIFRKFPEGDVIALFPEDGQGRGLIGSYMTIGQHGDAAKSLITDLEPASKEEYAKLAAELERIGYDIVIAESVNELTIADVKAATEKAKKRQEKERKDTGKSSVSTTDLASRLKEAKAMDTIRKIADEKSAMKVKFDNGQMMVDMFTASAIKSVYDNVNDANKEKLDNLMKTKDGMMKVANLSMKMLKEGKIGDLASKGIGAAKRGISALSDKNKDMKNMSIAKKQDIANKGMAISKKAADVTGKVSSRLQSVGKVAKGIGSAIAAQPEFGLGGSSYSGRRESIESITDKIMNESIKKANKEK